MEEEFKRLLRYQAIRDIEAAVHKALDFSGRIDPQSRQEQYKEVTELLEEITDKLYN